MKKILIAIVSVLLLTTGCSLNNMSSTPTSVVEDYLNEYQKNNDNILDQIKDIFDMDDLNDDNKTAYEDALKRQNQDLEYTVKDETIDGDEATVEVEIEVYDYMSSFNESDKYLKDNEKDFYNNKKEVDNDEYMKYKYSKLKDIKEKTKYTIYFTLTKEDNEWTINDLSRTDKLKLRGLYTESKVDTDTEDDQKAVREDNIATNDKENND